MPPVMNQSTDIGVLNERLKNLQDNHAALSDALSKRLDRLDILLEKQSEKIDVLQRDINTAKGGLRIGYVIATAFAGTIGWLAAHLLGAKP